MNEDPEGLLTRGREGNKLGSEPRKELLEELSEEGDHQLSEELPLAGFVPKPETKRDLALLGLVANAGTELTDGTPGRIHTFPATRTTGTHLNENVSSPLDRRAVLRAQTYNSSLTKRISAPSGNNAILSLAVFCSGV